LTPKEWAIANGYDVKPGRGRMPRHITEAYRAAMGNTDSTPKRKPSVTPKTKTVTKPVESGVIETQAPVYGPNAKVFAWIDGKKVYGSMRAACFLTGLSLTYCPCESHRAIVSNTSGYVPVIVVNDGAERNS